MEHFLNIEIQQEIKKPGVIYKDKKYDTTSFVYLLDISTLVDINNKETSKIETYLKTVFDSYKTVCKDESFISVSISYLSQISGTVPTLYTYDGEFYKH